MSLKSHHNRQEWMWGQLLSCQICWQRRPNRVVVMVIYRHNGWFKWNFCVTDILVQEILSDALCLIIMRSKVAKLKIQKSSSFLFPYTGYLTLVVWYVIAQVIGISANYKLQVFPHICRWANRFLIYLWQTTDYDNTITLCA